MLRFLPGPLKGALVYLFLGINTILWVIPIVTFALFKFLVPLNPWRKVCDKILNGCGSAWVTCNSVFIDLTQRTKWDVEGISNLDRQSWYLVVSNHCSWTDILVLQKIFNRKIPFLKFFLKKELIFVPVIGLAWWALDFPFMKRYSKKFLKKHPHLAGKDIETTRKACEKFKKIPISIMNFVEGTRFTQAKHDRQNSPFKHLLKPKAGGIGYVMSILGSQINQMLNVTIVYPKSKGNGFWDFASGKVEAITVRVSTIDISDKLALDYINNPQDRTKIQAWLNELWTEKDLLISDILGEPLEPAKAQAS